MSADETARAAAVTQQEADAMAVDAPLPNTPTQSPAATDSTGLVGDSLPGVATRSVASGSSSPAAPTIQELLGFLAKQAETTNAIMRMMAENKKNGAHYLASAKLDEKYFRSIDKFNNTKSGWKEWRRHFLNAVRECDDSFADISRATKSTMVRSTRCTPTTRLRGSSRRSSTIASLAILLGQPSRL